MSQNSAESIETSLIDGVRAGHPEAQGRLFELCVRVVFRSVLGMRTKWKLSVSDVEDITRNTATRVLEKFSQFRRDPPEWTFSKWLQTLTNHEVTNCYRSRGGAEVVGGSTFLQRLHELPATAEVSSMEDWQSEQIRRVDLIRAALEHLKATRPRIGQTTWESFERTAMQGQTSEEAAVALQLSALAVRKNKERVLEVLRTYLEGLLD